MRTWGIVLCTLVVFAAACTNQVAAAPEIVVLEPVSTASARLGRPFLASGPTAAASGAVAGAPSDADQAEKLLAAELKLVAAKTEISDFESDTAAIPQPPLAPSVAVKAAKPDGTGQANARPDGGLGPLPANPIYISAIRLVVKTKDASAAGTNDRIHAHLYRRDRQFADLELFLRDGTQTLRRRSTYTFNFMNLPFNEDPRYLSWDGWYPRPLPTHGFEYIGESSLKIRLQTEGEDLWARESLEMYVKYNRLTWLGWSESDWTFKRLWNQRGVVLSRDPREGVTFHDMVGPV